MGVQSFEKIVMHSLTFSERRIICRLITGKVGLNDYLYNIQKSESPDCIWCEEEEHVENFLIECLKYQDLSRYWWTNVQKLLPDINILSLSMKYSIIGDRTWKPDIRIKVVKAAAKFVVDTKRKI
ncbi:hypothetical protein RFI_33922 [Reticulomyxa filosa]|uniref:Reverse transcriptase zinc-binding domain-containing protein n=1 Tax=Reticulomyxa filosa TaxID=46433 RepID=X6LPF0_RETFI|nr:hypothetical protein RFI_33922 [Reticulomyxa filosa]|eukprot:ETO03484.1 hypothetical protein RFI_33922 [Reticulomyxa filosa]